MAATHNNRNRALEIAKNSLSVRFVPCASRVPQASLVADARRLKEILDTLHQRAQEQK